MVSSLQTSEQFKAVPAKEGNICFEHRGLVATLRWASLRITGWVGLVATATDTARRSPAMAVQGENFIARRTESLDADKIASLVTKHTETVFGRVDVENIM